MNCSFKQKIKNCNLLGRLILFLNFMSFNNLNYVRVRCILVYIFKYVCSSTLVEDCISTIDNILVYTFTVRGCQKEDTNDCTYNDFTLLYLIDVPSIRLQLSKIAPNRLVHFSLIGTHFFETRSFLSTQTTTPQNFYTSLRLLRYCLLDQCVLKLKG